MNPDRARTPPGARTLQAVFHDIDFWPGDAVRLNEKHLLNEYLTDLNGFTNGVVLRIEQRDATDSDGDGMPDWWEEEYALKTDNLSDRTENPDGDRRNNFEEYRAHSAPWAFDPQPFLSAYPDMSVVGTFNN